VEDGYYRILGRTSIDIIKSGGYKVSALEVEEVLRTHPAIGDCAVVGVPDPEWGERVCVAVLEAGDGWLTEERGPAAEALTLEVLRAWAKERLAAYKIPRELRLLDELPRNAMGKVIKTEVRTLFE
jgi:malonyl-CoA/methylmalonyl-CoA synthetase